MLYGAVMIFLLVVLGGLIAYIGDRVGMKVGKRRVTMFGLRPKYTSIIVTIITGIVIVSLTLAVLLAVSKQSRTAFFGIQNLLKDLKEKETELAGMSSKFEAEEKKMRESLADSTKNLKESRAALKSKQDELDDIIGEINIRSLELSKLQDSVDEMAEKVLDLNKKRKDLEETIQKLDKQISMLKKTYTNLVAETNQDVLFGDVIYRKDQPLARVAMPAGIGGAEMRKLLWNTMNEVFRNAVEAGATEEDDLGMMFESQLASLAKEVGKRDGDTILELRSHTNVLKGQPLHVTWTIVQNALVFRKGQVMGREVVQPGMSEDALRIILNGMLVNASSEARQAGMIPDPKTGRVGAIPKKRFDEVAAELSSSREPRTVELFVTDNVRISDTLNVDFKII